MKSRRTITIEFDRIKITTTLGEKKYLRCVLCGREAEFITRDEAVQLFKIMQIQGLNIKKENLHLYESNEAQILICLNSIINGGSNLQIY